MLRRSSKIGILAAVIISLGVMAYLMANVEMPGWSPIASGASVVLFAIPCFWAAKMWLGRRDAILVFIVLGIFALLVETLAVTTGYPYGHFGYSADLGYRLFGIVPWTVALAWTPLLLAAYTIAASVLSARSARIISTAVILMLFDTVIDPGAVRVGFWRYADGGEFYGVPVSNFAGWLISGFAGAALLELIVARLKPLLPIPIQLIASALLIILFWTLFAAFSGMAAPAAIGAVILVSLGAAWRKFHYHFDDKIVLVDENDEPVGTATKLEAHGSDTRRHRAFSTFIFNSRGELLLQQRAFSKKTWPGVWSNSCCGHVMLHEATEKAAARRLKFELGLRGVELITALPDFRYRAEKDGVVENEICPVLVGVTDAKPVPNPAEVASVRWIDWNEFLASLDEPGNEISPWAIEEVRLLASSRLFREWLAARVRVSGTNGPVC